MKLGLIGLGKMGSRIAAKLITDGHDVIVWNRSENVYKLFKADLPNNNFRIAVSLHEMMMSLKSPRIIWLMLPAGNVTQKILDEISKYIEKEDIIIDGGNSYYKDTERRFDKFSKDGIRYLGIGVSGGVVARESGYPLMVGGDKSAYTEIKPILDSLGSPNGGHDYFGEGGAGHYVKMVHNAIEYGYMQAIGEGFGLLDEASYKFDLMRVAKLYQKGTLISGFMMERTIEALGKDPRLSEITGVIGKASRETIWAVDEASGKGLFFDIIRRSLEIRHESEKNSEIQKSFAAKMVSALRNAFGGHDVKFHKDKVLQR